MYRLPLLAVAALAAALLTGCPQPTPGPLQITSPTNGAIVPPTFPIAFTGGPAGGAALAVYLDGRQVGMAAASPVTLQGVPAGPHTITLVAGSQQASVSVIVSGDTPPPPPPGPVTDLAIFVRDMVQRMVSSASVESEAAELAANFRDAHARIERLRDPLCFDGPFTAREWIAEIGQKNQATLGLSWTAWAPAIAELDRELNRRMRLPASSPQHIGQGVYDVGQACGQIAAGLAMVRAPRALEVADRMGFHVHLVADQVPRPPRPPATPEDNDIFSYAGIALAAAGTAAQDPELSPADVERAYMAGYIGAHVDEPGQPDWSREIAREGDQQFLQVSEEGLFSESSFPNEFRGEGRGKRAVYWNYALRFQGAPTRVYEIAQITGNCVEASNGDVTFTHLYGVSMFLVGEPYDWQGCGSSVMYAFRGHCGQGMNLGKAAAAHEKHGYAIRKPYSTIDLSDTGADQRAGMNNCRNPESSLSGLWAETRQQQIGRVAYLRSPTVDDAIDVLYVGGALHTGSTSTAAKNGDPVSTGARVGAHAQTCVGYDDTDEFRQWYRAKTGKTLNEPVFVFVQTWGNVQYVRSNWPAELWGRAPQGVFVLPWSAAKNLMQSTCYAYWPEGLGGLKPADLVWQTQ